MENQMVPTEHQNQRILTTSQLAEKYGTDEKRISENFNRNKERYSVGKHYFALEGEEKRAFINYTQIADGLKHAPVIYLWTEKGAWLHAKSLGTDEAWEAYAALVDEYYRVRAPQPTSIPEFLLQTAKAMVDQEKKIFALETAQAETVQFIQNLKATMLPVDKEWRKYINDRLAKIAQAKGNDFQGVKRDSYVLLEQRASCTLARRVKNLKDRLTEGGATKTAIARACRLDVIEQDKRLKEIYTAIVKELVIKYVA